MFSLPDGLYLPVIPIHVQPRHPGKENVISISVIRDLLLATQLLIFPCQLSNSAFPQTESMLLLRACLQKQFSLPLAATTRIRKKDDYHRSKKSLFLTSKLRQRHSFNLAVLLLLRLVSIVAHLHQQHLSSPVIPEPVGIPSFLDLIQPRVDGLVLLQLNHHQRHRLARLWV